MAKTKAELLAEAQERGLNVSEDNTVAEIREALAADGAQEDADTDVDETTESPNPQTDAPEPQEQPNYEPDSREVEEVEVNPNENQEAVNGTTEEDSEGAVSNTDSVPQNGVTEIETTEPDNPVSERADDARTEEEVKFADESNPNQKGRTQGASDAAEDVDGNERTGGKSYGVASEDPGVTIDQTEFQAGSAPTSSSNSVESYKLDTDPEANRSFLHGDTNAQEWDTQDAFDLEDRLSDEANGIKARVQIAAGDYVKVKFFRNGLVFGIYKSKKFDEAKAQEFLNDLKDQHGL